MGGMTDTKTVRIGNGQGFWGDSPDTPWEMINRGPVDYLTLDYLAEVTMSIMMRQKLRDPSRGYATDFISFLERALPMMRARRIKVVTNAGGLNPSACRERIAEIAGRIGVWGIKVGVVEGDDILARLDRLLADGHPMANMDTGVPLGELTSKVLSANVYLGAAPVAKALDLGADIVIAGRITDTSLALGPLMHEYGWARDDWDRLAAGVIAGHILECGAQATGGNFTRWWEVPELWDVGYPVVECAADGSFVVTKHVGTGGLVSVDTVAEQLVYEMGRPDGYITPDVVADFTSARLSPDGGDRVRVEGVKGTPATDTYKVSATYHDGYKVVGSAHRVGSARGREGEPVRRHGLEAAAARGNRRSAGGPRGRAGRLWRLPAGNPRARLRAARGRAAARHAQPRSPQDRTFRPGAGAVDHLRPPRGHRLRRRPAGEPGGGRLLAGAARQAGGRPRCAGDGGGGLRQSSPRR